MRRSTRVTPADVSNLNAGSANTVLATNGSGVVGWTASPTIGTSVTTPLVIGGTAAGSTLTLKSTSGAGTTDAIIFQVGNNGATEAARILTSGIVGVGTSVPNAAFSGGTVTPKFVVGGATVNGFAAIVRTTTPGGGSGLILASTRGTTVTDYTIVQTNDGMGQLSFQGSDGVDYAVGATIGAAVDNTPGSNVMPGRITVTTANATGTLVERARFDSLGNVKIGAANVRGTTESAGGLCLFNAATAPVGTLTDGITLFSASGKLKSADAAGTVGFVLSASAVTTEAVASDRTFTVDFNGTTYKILARA